MNRLKIAQDRGMYISFEVNCLQEDGYEFSY